MIVIDRKAPWIRESAQLGASPAELGHERAIFIITREYLHSMVFAIGDKQETSMMIERQASRQREQTISMAWLLGADRELDSSITSKSIVSHRKLASSLSLSRLTCNDEEMFQARDFKARELPLTRHDETRCSNETMKEQWNAHTHDRSSALLPFLSGKVHQPLDGLGLRLAIT